MPDRVPVLFDTDIGSDIDDAVALAYLLRQPRCELLGVTTVTGDVTKRCALARAICEAAGRPHVPVHAGAPRVLLYGPGQPEVPQYEALKNRPHRMDWAPAAAVPFLRSAIRARPGEVTLLTVGPLTNVALLFGVDPEIPRLLREVVSMAGVFFGKREDREWNCLVDPVATAIVCRATAAAGVPHRFFGLDVTTRCRMPAPEVRARFDRPPLDLVREMAEIWFQDRSEITFHDPLAAAAVFEPDLCTYAVGLVAGDPSDGDAGGRTLFAEGAGPHRVANAVDVEAFFRSYFSVFN
jgi:purine nucleosidase